MATLGKTIYIKTNNKDMSWSECTIIGGSQKKLEIKVPHELVSKLIYLFQVEADKLEQDTINKVLKMNGVK